MKIAFTSCCDHIQDAEQHAWEQVSALRPDVIVLLGDNIYMDYLSPTHQYQLNAPSKIPVAEFSDAMYRYYVAQWNVRRFQDAIRNTPKVYAIWDDHDFGWNNSRAGGTDDGSRSFMPALKRKVSRQHFEQFRRSLINKPANYPNNSVPNPAAVKDLGGIYTHVDLNTHLRLLLLDGRTFRESEKNDLSIHGEEQWKWIRQSLMPRPGVNLVASGMTLSSWRKERYKDYGLLTDLAATHNILVLSGDIHEPEIREHNGILEVTASAMAQPGFAGVFGKKSEVFGVLDVSTDSIAIGVWHKNYVIMQKSIDIAKWGFEA